MQDKKIIEEYFDTISKTYDENNKKMYWKLSDDLLWNIIKKFIPKTKSFNFLELGCGTGEWANKILGEFPNSSCVLVDFSNEMLKETKQKLAKYDKRVEIIKVDIENLKINKKFDLVLNIYVLPFFDNTEKLISVVSNCLRTGGKSISVAENYYNGLALNFLVGNINSIKELTENRDGYLSKYVPKLHFDKMNDLVKLHFDNGLIPIFKCGFPVISLIGVGESLTENNNSISKILKENYNYIFELEQNYIEDESLCNRGKYICIVGEKK